MRDGFFSLLIIAALISVIVSPWVVCRKLDRIAEGQQMIHAGIALLDGDDDDDDGDDDDPDSEPVPAEPANVIAIGRRAA